MNLFQALRLTAAARLAIVGAGGKTTAMIRIARDSLTVAPNQISSVILTASTHLSLEQLRLADHHYFINSPKDLKPFKRQIPTGSVLFTGPVHTEEDNHKRVIGLDFELLKAIHQLVDRHKVPLLIEADGARQLPLKAPSNHEPAIPSFCNGVLVTFGISGVDQPLTHQWVHRPEKFAELSGLKPGQTISTPAIARVLLHPNGGLKNIPSAARRVVLINQAKTQVLQASALSLSRKLIPTYQAVIIADLQSVAPGDSYAAPKSPMNDIFAIHESIAAIILAAGGSQRFGQSKQLLEWHNAPFIQHVARAALEAKLSPVVVVTGDSADRVNNALQGWQVSLVHNPNWHLGQSTTIQAGLQFLPPGIGAVIFLLADQPQVSCDVLLALVELHAATLAPIIIPQVDGQQANPVLFDCSTFIKLMEIQGDVGGRALFSQYPITWLPWNDRSLLFDIDTPLDYQRFIMETGNQKQS